LLLTILHLFFLPGLFDLIKNWRRILFMFGIL